MAPAPSAVGECTGTCWIEDVLIKNIAHSQGLTALTVSAPTALWLLWVQLLCPPPACSSFEIRFCCLRAVQNPKLILFKAKTLTLFPAPDRCPRVPSWLGRPWQSVGADPMGLGEAGGA